MHELENDGQFREFTGFINQLTFIFVFMLHWHLFDRSQHWFKITVFLFVAINDIDRYWLFLELLIGCKNILRGDFSDLFLRQQLTKFDIWIEISISQDSVLLFRCSREEIFQYQTKKIQPYISTTNVHKTQRNRHGFIRLSTISSNMAQNVGPRNYFGSPFPTGRVL